MPEVKIPEPQNDIQYLVWGLVAIVAIFMLSPAIVAFVKSKFSKEEIIKPEHPTDDHVCHQSGNLMDLMTRIARMEENQERMEKKQDRMEESQDSLEEKVDKLSEKIDTNQKEDRADRARVHERLDDLYKFIAEKLK